MKKSYHSIVVPMVDAMTALRSSALCSDADSGSNVVVVTVCSSSRFRSLGDRLRCLSQRQFSGKQSRWPTDASACSIFQPLLQRNSVVAGLIAGGEQQGDGPTGQSLDQVMKGRLRRSPFEFGVISGLEVAPSGGIPVQAAAQGVARCDLLQPEIDFRALSRQTARPQPIY